MPSYKTHDLVAYTAAPIVTVAATTITTTEYALLFGVAFILANHYLSPDLDIDSIMNRRWKLLRFIWIPYKRMFHHRSFFTHSGPISATIRIVYFLLWFLPFVFFIPYQYLRLFVTEYSDFLLLLYLAIVAADTLHTGLDFITYGTRKLIKIPFGFWKNAH